VSRKALIKHLRSDALFMDGPYTLRSGVRSDWYLDARLTTLSSDGAPIVGSAVLEVLDGEVEAIGGMTMGADPIAMAVVLVAGQRGRHINAFSVRKTTKQYGTGGRLVGPVSAGMAVAIVEDTTTTGGAMIEASEAAMAAGLRVVQAISLLDRSEGRAADAFAVHAIPYQALLLPKDLGVK
jgi:orotate phosphoribosyltransferase